MVLFVAFVVDAGHAFVDQRHLQMLLIWLRWRWRQRWLGLYRPAGPACLNPTVTLYATTNNGGPSGIVPCDATHTSNCYEWPYV